jgi:drug/metabolite transporter (DMT)-like permease
MKTRIWAAMLAVYIVWGSTYLAIRFAVENMPPLLMAATRFLVAGAILYAWMRLRGAPAPQARHWRPTGIVGLFLLLGGNGLVVTAELRVPSGIAALMIGATPLWLVLVDALRPNGVRPTWRTLAGVLIGLAGITLLINPASLGGLGEGVDPLGAGMLLMAALFWAMGSIYSREHKEQLPQPALLATGMEMLVGGAALLLLGLLTGEAAQLDLAAISTRSLLGLGYLIFFGSLVGFASYTWLLGVAPTPLVSTYAYVNPLVAVLLGSLLAAEPLTPRILVAAGIIISSVVLINTAQFSARPAAPKNSPPASLSRGTQT